MDVQQFLQSLGWPQDRMGEAGLAQWSGEGSEPLSTIQAKISRSPQAIVADIDVVDVGGPQSLLSLRAEIADGLVRVSSSSAGSPPEDLPAEDAAALFLHMGSGLPKFRFESFGPIVLPKSKASF